MSVERRMAGFTDGAAKGNPGPAGYGYVIEQDGVLLEEGGAFIGDATNNVAEYQGFIAVLTRMAQLGATDIALYSDSELAVRQVNKVYRVKNEGLRPLYEQVMHLLGSFDKYQVRHIPREQNARADRLANKAISERRKLV